MTTPTAVPRTSHQHHRTLPQPSFTNLHSIPFHSYPNKSPSTFRLYFININGLQYTKSNDKWHSMCDSTRQLQIDQLSLAETNVATERQYVRNELLKIAKKFFHNPQLQTSQTRVKSATTYKPGGTASLSTGSFNQNITNSGADALGRWSYTTYQGSKDLTIITVYQVCKRSDQNQGRFTAYNQQSNLLHVQSINEQTNYRTPRQAFQQDLAELVRTHQIMQHEILIVGDFNDAFDTATSEIAPFRNATQPDRGIQLSTPIGATIPNI